MNSYFIVKYKPCDIDADSYLYPKKRFRKLTLEAVRRMLHNGEKSVQIEIGWYHEFAEMVASDAVMSYIYSLPTSIFSSIKLDIEDVYAEAENIAWDEFGQVIAFVDHGASATCFVADVVEIS